MSRRVWLGEVQELSARRPSLSSLPESANHITSNAALDRCQDAHVGSCSLRGSHRLKRKPAPTLGYSSRKHAENLLAQISVQQSYFLVLARSVAAHQP